ncbi:MAG: hypothetical protein GY750_19785 [Lentisphaerae bacterium]|nr:hypothetical protein [Lentisphaerota bacterium]MCP4103637.1 hypothetical protein [Lentisphaerota bacterium]
MHKEKIIHYKQRAELLLKLLRRDYLVKKMALDAEFSVTEEPVKFADKDGYDYNPIREGESWGMNCSAAGFM